MWNDAPNDSDLDGLGNRLERALGTCPHRDAIVNGFACDQVRPTDTDNDGIEDRDEVLGAPGLPYDLWGAHPAQKDVFVEMDYAGDTFRDNNNVAIPPTDVLNEMWAEAFIRGYAALSGVDVENPNGRNGVRVHIDVAGANKYGPDQRSPLSVGPNPAVLFDGGGSNIVGAEFKEACGNNDCGISGESKCYVIQRLLSMSQERRGSFRYWCAAASGGGQASGVAFKSGVGARTVAHELGHTLALEHGGHETLNCKPNYVSVMNYATGPFSQGQFSGQTLPSLNAVALCEDNPLRVPVDHLDESDPKVAFDFEVRGNDVDWNRDGVFSSCDVEGPVEATIRWATGDPNGGCSTFSRGGEKVRTAPGAARTPSVVRTVTTADAVDTIMIFFSQEPFFGSDITGNQLGYVFAFLPGACPNPNAFADGSCFADSPSQLGFHDPKRYPAIPTQSVDVSHFDVQGQPYLYAAIHSSLDDALELWRADPLATTDFTDAMDFQHLVDLTGPGGVAGEPVTHSWRESLWVMWRDGLFLSGAVVGPDGTAVSPVQPTTPSGDAIFSNTAPSLAIRPHPLGFRQDELFLLTTDVQGNLFLWDHRPDLGLGVFEHSTAYPHLNAERYENDGKPGFAWLPLSFDAPRGPGGFQVVSTKGSQPRRVYVDDDELRRGWWGNKWTDVFPFTGVDLLFNPGSAPGQSPLTPDASLRAAAISEWNFEEDDEDREWGLIFYPFGSGRGDRVLDGSNDARIMSTGICGQLVDPFDPLVEVTCGF